jgi:hypothetical protein
VLGRRCFVDLLGRGWFVDLLGRGRFVDLRGRFVDLRGREWFVDLLGRLENLELGRLDSCRWSNRLGSRQLGLRGFGNLEIGLRCVDNRLWHNGINWLWDNSRIDNWLCVNNRLWDNSRFDNWLCVNNRLWDNSRLDNWLRENRLWDNSRLDNWLRENRLWDNSRLDNWLWKNRLWDNSRLDNWLRENRLWLGHSGLLRLIQHCGWRSGLCLPCSLTGGRRLARHTLRSSRRSGGLQRGARCHMAGDYRRIRCGRTRGALLLVLRLGTMMMMMMIRHGRLVLDTTSGRLVLLLLLLLLLRCSWWRRRARGAHRISRKLRESLLQQHPGAALLRQSSLERRHPPAHSGVCRARRERPVRVDNAARHARGGPRRRERIARMRLPNDAHLGIGIIMAHIALAAPYLNYKQKKKKKKLIKPNRQN